MSIQQWAINSGAKGVIKDAEKDGRIKEFVVIADSAIKGIFPGADKEMKQLIVQHIIFPFCKAWLKEDPDGFQKAKSIL